MLRHISPAVKHTEPSSPNTPTSSTRPAPLSRRSESYVLDDLDYRAAKAAIEPRKEIAVIKCPMLRLSIRCPAPPNRRGTWGDGAHLRSGIVTLDLHGLHAKMSGPEEPGNKRTLAGDEQGGSIVEWKKMIFFFSRVPGRTTLRSNRDALSLATKSSAFLVIGPLSPEPGDLDPTVLLPSVHIKSTASTIDPDLKTSAITCQIPSVEADIRQATIEGLQFFADDLTHWLDGAFGDGSRPKPRDELKMIGSRFFGGSKGSSSASSSAIIDDEDDKKSATTLKLFITETDVSLHVPRSEGSTKDERVLAFRASDLYVAIDTNIAGRQETAVSLSIMDATFADETDLTSKRIILSRTTPFTLAAQNHPIMHLRFSSLTDGMTDTKETSIKTILSSFTFFVTSDITWISDLAAFAKTPEGVFEDVVPSEVTRIVLEVYDSSIHLTPPSLTGAAVVVLGVLEVRSDIVSGAEESLLEMTLGSSGFLLVDDTMTTASLIAGLPSSVEAWKVSLEGGDNADL
jgi:autophagy-related protein 2